MANAILSARIASLEVSLMKVQNLLTWTRRRQECVDKMTKLLEDSSTELRRAYRSVDRYVHQQLLDAEDRGVPPPDLQEAVAAIDTLKSVGNRLRNGQEEVLPKSSFVTQISARGAAQEIERQFRNNATAMLKVLENLHPADPDAWQAYETERPRVHGLLTAYSDCLAGFALRDSGFDEDICEIAEALLKCLAISKASSPDLLTIPISHELRIPIVEIMRAVIQLSYEWTIWSLPVVAHEFWRSFALQQEEVRNWFKPPHYQGVALDVDDPGLCLGDAFAACSMGPAYAYFAFLLALNPVDAFSDPSNEEPASAKRALAILTALGPGGNGKIPAWGGVVERLGESWHEAVNAANRGAGSLAEAEKVKIVHATSHLVRELETNTEVPYTDSNWEHAGKWSADLKAGTVGNISVDPSDRIPDVLNAAWIARDGVSDPNQISGIAESAGNLRRRIPSVRGGGQGGYPQVA